MLHFYILDIILCANSDSNKMLMDDNMHQDVHAHTHLAVLFLGLYGLAGTRRVKPIWILLKQETLSGSGICWAICKSAPRSRQITMLTPHHSVFLWAGPPQLPNQQHQSTEGQM